MVRDDVLLYSLDLDGVLYLPGVNEAFFWVHEETCLSSDCFLDTSACLDLESVGISAEADYESRIWPSQIACASQILQNCQ